MDLDHLPEFPSRFGDALREAIRGRSAVWPEEMNGSEREAIEAHGMLPLVRAFAGLSTRDRSLGDAAIESLRLIDLRSVLAALRIRGVVPLVLKGTALAHLVYPLQELRPRVDVDLLVDRADASRASEALVESGFETRLTSGDELGYRQQLFTRDDTYGLRHAYDLHFDLTNNAVTASTLTYQELRERAQPLVAVADDALALSDVDSLLYACIHRAVHHHGSLRLVWLYDVHLLCGRLTPEQWSELWRRAGDRRIVTICTETIAAAESWFGALAHPGAEAILPAEVIARAEPSAGFLEPGRSRGAVLAGDLAALPGWGSRARRLWQLAFPPAGYMLERTGGRRLMLPWLYLVRAARGIARLFRKV